MRAFHDSTPCRMPNRMKVHLNAAEQLQKSPQTTVKNVICGLFCSYMTGRGDFSRSMTYFTGQVALGAAHSLPAAAPQGGVPLRAAFLPLPGLPAPLSGDAG